MRTNSFATAFVLWAIVVGTLVGPMTTIGQTPSSPVLLLTKFSLAPQTLSPGSTVVANVTVKAENSLTAYGAVVSFTPTAPLFMVGSGSTFYLGDMPANRTRSFTFVIGANPVAKVGNYPISYSISCNNATGAAVSSTGQVFVPVAETPVKPQLVVSSVSTLPVEISPGIKFTSVINVTNMGTDVAYGSTMFLSLGPDLTLSGSVGTVALGTLEPGRRVSVSVKMTSSPSAPTETIPLKFDFAYTDRFGISYTSNSSYDVQITSTPDLRVGSFSLSSAPLRPGVFGFLTLSIIDVGGDRAYGVKLVLTGSPLFSGNSVNYLGAIDAGSRSSASFFFNVANRTSPGSYSLSLAISYTDLLGKLYSSTANYAVSVEPYAPPSVTVTNILLDPPVLTPGTQGTLTIFLKNTGTTQAQKVLVTVGGGSGIVTSNSFGLGTLNPGDQVTQVVGINVDPRLTPGGYTLTIGTTYSDPSGAEYSSSTPMQTGVYGGVNIFSVTNIAIIAGVVVLAILALILLRRFDLV